MIMPTEEIIGRIIAKTDYIYVINWAYAVAPVLRMIIKKYRSIAIDNFKVVFRSEDGQ